MKFIAKINFVLGKLINKSSLIRSFFTDLFDFKQLERKPAYNIPIYIRLFIFSFLILVSINTAQATTFTETVPNGHGAIPATYPAVGGTMIVLVGANGNIYYQFVNPSTQFEGFSDDGTPVAFRGNPLQLGPTQTLNCGTTACSTYFGGSIVEGYARLTVRDGDACAGEFDANDVYFELNGLRVSSFTGIPVIAPSSISTQRTNMAGTTANGTENCFRNQTSTETSTAWFDLGLVPGLLNNILTVGSTTPRVFDDDPTDNRWFFTDGVDATGTPEVAPGISIDKSADKTSYSAVGELINYTFVVTNVGSVNFTNVIVTDTYITGSISCPSTNLAVSTSMTCTAAHTVTQDNIDFDTVFVNVAEATGTPTEGTLGAVSGTVTVTGPAANNSMTLTKVADKTVDVVDGEVITYTYTVENTGNITLENVNITDVHNGSGVLSPIAGDTITVNSNGLSSDASIDGSIDSLAPGDSAKFTSQYTITQADIDAGIAIANTATGNSTPKRGSISAPTASESVSVIAASASQSILKVMTGYTDADSSSTISLNDTLSYSVTMTNDGNVTLNNVVVSDNKITPSSNTCATVAPGATCVLNGTYMVLQADVDAGTVDNIGSVTSTEVPGPTVTPTVSTAVSKGASQSIAKVLSGNADEDSSSTVSLNDTLSYNVTMTNDGDVTLNNVVVSDNKITPSSNTCATVAPGATCVLSGTYVVSQTDVDAGTIDNIGSVSSTEVTGPTVTPTVSTPVTQAPSLSITKTAATMEAVDFYIGAIATYTYVVTNTGNITITSPVTVSDNLIPI